MKPLARYAALNSYVDVSRALGIEPARMMREAGLDPAGIAVQDRWIPAAAVALLLERSAAISGHQDFGLLLAERRRFANLGPLSLVIREEPDVRSALTILLRHEHMYNEALRMRMAVLNGLATVRVAFELGDQTETRQAAELALGTLHRLLRGFLGPLWQPVAVCFAHRAPADPTTHQRVFGSMLKFEQDFNGITFYEHDLDAPNKMSDPLMRTYAYQFLDSLETPKDTSALERVRELIELLLPTGRCSVEQVARSLGVDRRTVHRQLADAGETFSSLLQATRAELAANLVGNQRYTFTEITDLLSFSSPGNFSRWFRAHFACSPSQWRSRHRNSD
ncbi:AraC-type DNA-binding protein [Saccharopolyspora antimicrobica]|uniref:AraC-like DNA-binding protein n=1 Tax=Saccharopolyspora antimicrobica TaxID=455193 RepID=A0A1I5JWR7_9PSEU|nr:AraC family transcriptional regulator [Saccharopolyspora antimicrobica]RKT86961.1 AraC-like DNA-binding protein [Saccharopolyspora antimicrobica]SFO76821.1 AraC-type DNA-binding protein [Saccharopolyspora antimicrobica]